MRILHKCVCVLLEKLILVQNSRPFLSVQMKLIMSQAVASSLGLL